MNSKECKKCGQLKPLSEFSKNKNEPDGLKRYCKQCVSLESKKYREQHRDEINHRKIISYRKSKEFADERTAAQLKEETRICSVCSVEKPITDFYKCGNGGFRTYCKLCANIKSQEYQSNNRDSIIMKKREYHLAHKTEIDEYNRQYYQSHSEEVKERVHNWITAHIDQDRDNRQISQQRQRSLKEGLEASLTRQEWQECKAFFSCNGQLYCAYCGKPLERATQDHMIPMSIGGSYTKENILPACLSCNSSKGNKDFWEWYLKQPFYSKEREERIVKYCSTAS